MEVEYRVPGGLGEALEAVREALRARAWLVFLGTCFTEYEGRAASRSTPGDMLVMVKPDGSVIVHGPRGFKPLNWQPDTASITADIEGGELVVRAVRRKPRETLVVRCASVYHVVWAHGASTGEFWMYLNEHEIRDAIARDPSLLIPGARITRVERPVDPGFIDLYGYDPEGRLLVVELKRVKAGEAAVRQLLRYVEALEKKGYRNIRPILAAPDFTEAAVRLASLSGVELVRLDLQRIYEVVRGQRRPQRHTLEDYL